MARGVAPTYVDVFTMHLHDTNWHRCVSTCQNVEGPRQLMCQCLTTSRSESHLWKRRGIFIQMNQQNCWGGRNGRIITEDVTREVLKIAEWDGEVEGEEEGETWDVCKRKGNKQKEGSDQSVSFKEAEESLRRKWARKV